MFRLFGGSSRVELGETAPPLHCKPEHALELSQRATQIIQSAGASPYDDTSTWAAFETLFYSCLRTEDDRCASRYLEALSARFGADDMRVMALRGLYEEATARSDSELEQILRRYESVIEADPTNIPVAKRRIGLLKSMGRKNMAIQGLVDLLEMSTTDAEAWTELAELYMEQQQFRQAIYCLEEVLLITPNSWNTWARLGEVYHLCTRAEWLGKDFDPETCFGLSIKAYCRSLELCDDYPRALCGLKMACKAMLNVAKPRGSLKNVMALDREATSRLAAMIRVEPSTGLTGTDLQVAKSLINAERAEVVR